MSQEKENRKERVPLLWWFILITVFGSLYLAVYQTRQLNLVRAEKKVILKDHKKRLKTISTEIELMMKKLVISSGLEINDKKKIFENRISQIQEIMETLKREKKNPLYNSMNINQKKEDIQKALDIALKLKNTELIHVIVKEAGQSIEKMNLRFVVTVNGNVLKDVSKDCNLMTLNESFSFKSSFNDHIKIELFEKGTWSSSRIAIFENSSPMSVSMFAGKIKLPFDSKNKSEYNKSNKFREKVFVTFSLKDFTREDFNMMHQYIWPGSYWDDEIAETD